MYGFGGIFAELVETELLEEMGLSVVNWEYLGCFVANAVLLV